MHGARWTVCGARCTVYGVRCTVHGVRSEVDGLRCTVCGARYTVCGARRMVYDVRCTVCGTRCTVCGARCAVYGAWCTIYGKLHEVLCRESRVGALRFVYAFWLGRAQCEFAIVERRVAYRIDSNPAAYRLHQRVRRGRKMNHKSVSDFGPAGRGNLVRVRASDTGLRSYFLIQKLQISETKTCFRFLYGGCIQTIYFGPIF